MLDSASLRGRTLPMNTHTHTQFEDDVVRLLGGLRFPCLASQKKTQSQLRFQIAKCKIASVAAEIAAEKSSENRREIAAIFLGRGIKIAAFPRSQIAAFSER